MKNSLLKKMAERAKNRLLGRAVSDFSENVCVKVVGCEDDEFRLRAREVFMRSEEDSSYNPIRMLMDEDVLIKLDERGREIYLLETVDKYLKAKNTFLRDIEIC